MTLLIVDRSLSSSLPSPPLVSSGCQCSTVSFALPILRALNKERTLFKNGRAALPIIECKKIRVSRLSLSKFLYNYFTCKERILFMFFTCKERTLCMFFAFKGRGAANYTHHFGVDSGSLLRTIPYIGHNTYHFLVKCDRLNFVVVFIIGIVILPSFSFFWSLFWSSSSLC